MRVFVTGATGFVGSHLVEALLADGHEVACLVRDPAKRARIFRDAPIQDILGDLRDADALRRGCAGAEVVYHAAALTAAKSRNEFFEINVAGTQRMLKAASAAGVSRFVYVSSVAAAGPVARGQQLLEDDPPHPVTLYGESKLAAEHALQNGAIPWIVVRPPTVYGPRDTELARAFKFARFGVMPVFGDGGQELTAIYVADLVTALRTVADRGRERTIYFATHPEIFTSSEFARGIYRAVRTARGAAAHDVHDPFILPLPSPVTRTALAVTGTTAKLFGRRTLLSSDKAAEFLAEGWACSAAKLASDTGWSASTPVATGLPETARWYRKQGWI